MRNTDPKPRQATTATPNGQGASGQVVQRTDSQDATQTNSRRPRRVWLGLIGAAVFVGLILLGNHIATWAWIPVWVFLVQRRDLAFPDLRRAR